MSSIIHPNIVGYFQEGSIDYIRLPDSLGLNPDPITYQLDDLGPQSPLLLSEEILVNLL
jgi:hypothetical protein